MDTKTESTELQALHRVEEKLDRLTRFVEALAGALVDSRTIDGDDFRLRVSGELRS